MARVAPVRSFRWRVIGGSGSWAMWYISATGVIPSYTEVPLSISYRIMPNE